MSVFYVYILETTSKSGKRTYYTGYTKNLLKRRTAHKNGNGAKYTRGKKIRLRYFETYFTQKEAMRRELEIKSFTHEEKSKLIENFTNRR
ncbi:MAG: GIY-YIG nuclease family protein [Candidatus Lokiarchaeota archaeon]